MQHVKTVETRSAWRDMAESPVPNEPMHYGHNAMSYWLIGSKAGQQMMWALGRGPHATAHQSAAL